MKNKQKNERFMIYERGLLYMTVYFIQEKALIQTYLNILKFTTIRSEDILQMTS